MNYRETYASFAVTFLLLFTAACLELPTEDVTSHQNIGLLKQDTCGPLSDSDGIFTDTGNSTRLFEFPWMALIGYNVTRGTVFRCSGSLINERYVLTAAHCAKFLPGNLQITHVRLGEHDQESEIDCEERLDGEAMKSVCALVPQDINVEEVIPHPKYEKKTSNHQNDIALLRLSRAVNFDSDSIKSICLPIGLPQQTENLDGKPLVVSGWRYIGKSNEKPVLSKATIAVISYESCDAALRNLTLISPVTQLCAGTVRDDTCLGEGGSPFVYYGQVNGRRRVVQHGIVSFGPAQCKNSKIPAVYTRVGPFMKWILDSMRP